MKTQRKLNDKQLQILKVIYKFRFVTPNLLAEHRGVLKWSMQNALNILTDYGYVARRYEKTYKIDRKPASYHLTPKALKLLRDENDLNENVLHTRYKDRSVGQPFIDHNLTIFKTYLDLKKSHPDTFNIFTKSELADFDYFLKPLPDLYMSRVKSVENKPNDYMLDIFNEHTQAFVVKNRIDQYVDHFEEGEWIEDEYPSVIMKVYGQRTAETLNNYIEKKKDETYIEDELALIATQDSKLTLVA